jgi:hypothetical protein
MQGLPPYLLHYKPQLADEAFPEDIVMHENSRESSIQLGCNCMWGAARARGRNCMRSTATTGGHVVAT